MGRLSPMRHSAEALKGLTPLLVLDVLAREERSAVDILRAIRAATQNGIELADGTIYPLLYRLEAEGRIRGEWREVPGSRRQRVYALTPQGRTLLRDLKEGWTSLLHSLQIFLHPAKASP